LSQILFTVCKCNGDDDDDDDDDDASSPSGMNLLLVDTFYVKFIGQNL
jgi:hypothetical protein